jgi:hypothetical protein
VTPPQNIGVTENAVIHVEKSEKSVIDIDQAARSMWMTELSFPQMFRTCVTLAFFFNSEDELIHFNPLPPFLP